MGHRTVEFAPRLDWTLEFDDGSGADRVQEHPGPINEGQELEAYGQRWIVDRVDPDRLYAHAKPADV